MTTRTAKSRKLGKETWNEPERQEEEEEDEEESSSSSEEEDDTDEEDGHEDEDDDSSVKSDQDFDLNEVSEDDHVDEEDDNPQEEENVQQEDEEQLDNQPNPTADVVSNEVVAKEKSTCLADMDEYEYDSSDEEDLRNTVGNIPIHWYDNYDHIGYDTEGNKIVKPKGSKSNEIDEFMRKMEDPYFWRTVKDKMTGENVILTDADAEALKRVKKGFYPDANYNPYPDFIDFFTYETMIHPVTNRPETKASFIPSVPEKRMISRLVAKIKRKWQDPKLAVAVKKDTPFDFDHDLWEHEEGSSSKRQEARRRRYIPAPKLRPPHHRESYNPPPEYCASEEEVAKWKEKDPLKRHFLPQQFSNLRSVPAYTPFVKERFERCLDLYLCPRVRKMKADVDPEDLIPKLPRPKELQPFPTQLAILYKGHEDTVRSVSMEPMGQFVATGSDDKTVKVWEVLTGRCFKTFKFDHEVMFVSWCCFPGRTVLAVASGKDVILLNPGVGSKISVTETDNLFEKTSTEQVKDRKGVFEWKLIPKEEGRNLDWKDGKRVVISHNKPVTQIAWHSRGDYFAAVMPTGANRSVIIHQLSKKRSQIPFSKANGIIQCVLFHPSRPYFIVGTQKSIRIYNLMKQEMSKKLLPNCNMISSIAIHPGGDNLIVGSFDSKLPWFDLDLSTKPYKMMRYHKKAIRSVDFHPKYPLFASASDDGSVIVSHGMVYNDLNQNALVVPVKILRGHQTIEGVSVMDCKFHPLQPWIISCGSDRTVRLYS